MFGNLLRSWDRKCRNVKKATSASFYFLFCFVVVDVIADVVVVVVVAVVVVAVVGVVVVVLLRKFREIGNPSRDNICH